MEDYRTPNSTYLREWAADIRSHGGHSADADQLTSIAENIERMTIALVKFTVGTCRCGAKSPEIKYHKPNCRYRIAEEALGGDGASEIAWKDPAHD